MATSTVPDFDQFMPSDDSDADAPVPSRSAAAAVGKPVRLSAVHQKMSLTSFVGHSVPRALAQPPPCPCDRAHARAPVLDDTFVRAEMLAVDARLTGDRAGFVLLAPGRRLLHQGDLRKKGTSSRIQNVNPRKVFLFSDVLLLTKEKGRGKLVCKDVILLRTCALHNQEGVPGAEPHSFVVDTPTKPYALIAADEVSYVQWLHWLSHACWDCALTSSPTSTTTTPHSFAPASPSVSASSAPSDSGRTVTADTLVTCAHRPLGWRHMLYTGTLWHAAVVGDATLAELLFARAATQKMSRTDSDATGSGDDDGPDDDGDAGASSLTGGSGAGAASACAAHNPVRTGAVVHVRARDVCGWCPLQYACALGHTGVVQALLGAGASPVAPTRTGAGLAHVAVARGHVGVLRVLLDNGVGGDEVDGLGEAPLLTLVRAVARGLHRNATRDAPVPDSTALACARLGELGACVGHGEAWGTGTGDVDAGLAVELADALVTSGGASVHVHSYEGVPVLALAVQCGLVHVALLLLSRGACSSVADPGLLSGGVAPSSAAVTAGAGAGVAVAGGTLLHAAAHCLAVDAEMFATLLKGGCHPNARDSRGRSALHVCLLRLIHERNQSAMSSPSAPTPAPASSSATPAAASTPVSGTGSPSAPSPSPAGSSSPTVLALARACVLLLRFGARCDVRDSAGVVPASLLRPAGLAESDAAAAGAEWTAKVCSVGLVPPSGSRVPACANARAQCVGRVGSSSSSRSNSSIPHRMFTPCPPSDWVPDAASPSCLACGSAFGTFTNRKHHCRHCGLLVCGSCMTKSFPLHPLGPSTPVKPPQLERVCDGCFNGAIHFPAVCAAVSAFPWRQVTFPSAPSTSVSAGAAPLARAASASASSDPRARPGRSGASAGSSNGTSRGGAASAGVGGVRDTMQRNAVLIDERGQRINDLGLKTQQLSDSAGEFEKMAKLLAGRR